MLVAEYSSNNLFTAFSNVVGKEENAFSHKYQYICDNHKCNQNFVVNWEIRANPFNPYIPRGSYVICPYCGMRHAKNVALVADNEQVPDSIIVKVHSYFNKVVLTINYKSFAFKGLMYAIGEEAKETFTFNMKTGKSYFEKAVKYMGNYASYTKVQINKNNLGAIESNSVLSFLNKTSLVYKDSNFLALIKELHEEIKELFLQKHNYVPKNLYINTKGLENGLLLNSLFNYAYKIIDVNAVCERKDSFKDKESVLHFINTIDMTRKDFSLIKKLADEKDVISSAIEVLGLENQKAIRKAIVDGIKLIALTKAKGIFSDNQHYLTFASYLDEHSRFDNNIQLFMKHLKLFYSEKEINHLVVKGDIAECARIFHNIGFKYREKFNHKVRIRDLHDYLSDLQGEELDERHVIKHFKAPKAVVNRFIMHLENSNFKLPLNSLELRKAGRELRNCVATYADSIFNKELNIVFMTDDTGKIMACLKVKNNCLVEAKLARNIPVHREALINTQVLDWARRAELEIKTRDVLESSFQQAVTSA